MTRAALVLLAAAALSAAVQDPYGNGSRHSKLSSIRSTVGEEGFSRDERARLLTLSPLGAVPPSPTNELAGDPGAARLGHWLYFDARLSANGEVSCATCHDPAQGWSDGRPRAKGLAEVRRNAPTVLGAAHNRWQFWDGRADSLWAQALQPIEDPAEMGFSRTGVAHLVQEDEELRSAYERIFGELPDFSDRARFPDHARPRPTVPTNLFEAVAAPVEPPAEHPHYQAWASMSAEDQDLVNRVFANIGKCIEAYERLLVPPPAPFDTFAAGLREDDPARIAAISPQARDGAKLFAGKGQCMLCHFGPRFSDSEFHNVGLGVPRGEDFDHGRVDGIKKVQLDPFNGRGAYSAQQDWDTNVKLRYLFYDEHTYASYKTPTLRNVTRTAPYGHDGRFATLREVLRFYSELPGDASPIGHREESMRAIRFSEEEIDMVLAFLETLASPPLPEALRTRPASPALPGG